MGVYRIHFEPKGAYWCIQFLKWSLFWQSVFRRIEGPGEPVLSVMEFETLADAEKYVKDRGIDQAYLRKDEPYFADMVEAATAPMVVRRRGQ